LLDLVQAAPQAFRQDRSVNKDTVQQLLAAAVQRLQAAQLEAVPAPVRLDTAYDAVLFCALAVIAARGFRVDADQGHHVLALEAMAAELRLSEVVHDELDALRRRRNAKYTGFTRVNPADLATALRLARRVVDETDAWFLREKAGFLKRD
jgi:hypothetical protein